MTAKRKSKLLSDYQRRQLRRAEKLVTAVQRSLLRRSPDPDKDIVNRSEWKYLIEAHTGISFALSGASHPNQPRLSR